MSARDERPLICVTDVRRAYGEKDTPVHALRGVSLEISRGERIALLGKSGSGKSTLLGLLGGLDRASSGSIAVDGQELGALRTDELAAYRLRTVGMIFQSWNLIPSRTALENVELPLIFAGVAAGARREQALRALTDVGLAARVHHRPGALSGGEHQRVAIARAMINSPTILLADEPTGNLDSFTAADVMAVLQGHLGERGMTMVMVTHDEELARRSADRIVRLQDGQVVS